MEMKRCLKGHYYDASTHADCPYCNEVKEVDMTVAMNVGTQDSNVMDKTVPLGASYNKSSDDEGKTIAMFKTSTGVDPVVGWLVNLEGAERGKEYRLHAENNFVGRSEKMDVCIKADDTISRENQAIITYEIGDKVFYLSPGSGRSVIKLNGKPVFQTVELKAYDMITMGKTQLTFVPFCGERFTWEE